MTRTREDEKKEEKKGDANLFYASYDYDELINRDKASLDIFWLRDETLEESNKFLDLDVLAPGNCGKSRSRPGTVP